MDGKRGGEEKDMDRFKNIANYGKNGAARRVRTAWEKMQKSKRKVLPFANNLQGVNKSVCTFLVACGRSEHNLDNQVGLRF
jgi:hypothetical protein